MLRGRARAPESAWPGGCWLGCMVGGFRNMFWVFGLVNIQRGGEASIGENVGFT